MPSRYAVAAPRLRIAPEMRHSRIEFVLGADVLRDVPRDVLRDVLRYA